MTEPLSTALTDDAYDPEPQRRAAQRKAARPREPLESEIVSDVLTFIKSLPMGYARKVHGGPMGNRGEPDVDACVRGRSCKLEGKARRDRPTLAQLAAMKRWRKAGALVGWFRSVEHVGQILDHLDDSRFEVNLEHPGCTCGQTAGVTHPHRQAEP